MGLTRRQFLRGAAVSTIGAVAFTGCAPARFFEIESPANIPKDTAIGRDNWYASTCGLCSAGCGIIVRVTGGRVKKIEGNPDFPVNQGKLCSIGQAGPQVLYDPNRITSPLKRNGDRGQQAFVSITWDEALDELVSRLKQAPSPGATPVMVAPSLTGSGALVVNNFVKGLGGSLLTLVPADQWAIRSATNHLFGSPRLPEFDIAAASYVLSFGADLFGSWLSPVHYGRGYAGLRDRAGGRGVLVQIEPRLSAMAAAADEWVPVRPGAEGALALSMAQVIVSENLATGRTGAPAALDQYEPDQVAEQTGVDAQRIRDLARAFAKARSSLAIGGEVAGYSNGLFNLSAIQLLNQLVGGAGSGGVRLNPAPPANLPDAAVPASLGDWQRFADQLGSGDISVSLLVGGANPVFALPAALKIREGLLKSPYVVSFSSVMDDSTALADLVLPANTYLEDWGAIVPDPGPGFQAVGLRQPVVLPFYDTRSFVDVLLVAASQLGGDVQRNLPWGSNEDVVRDVVKGLQGLAGGSVPASASFDEFWSSALGRGGWWAGGTVAASAVPSSLILQPAAASFAGDVQEYPFNLYPFMSSSLGNGQGAFLPWLQSVPEAMTTVAWGSWIEINPTTADRLGVQEGDVVRVESSSGSVEVSVYVFPGLPPDVVAMPFGQGHFPDLPIQKPASTPLDGLAPQGRSHSVLGNHAQGRGANPLEVIAPMAEKETDALAWSATRVRLIKTGKQQPLAKFGPVPVPPYTEEVVPIQTIQEMP
ncbi:MAG: 4Fe-4S ferredoxin [Chloroflexota bacterium]|nr:MAG: 4Fe-4S ferredoxin [Chloroflexota bacterium]